ncbi:RmlC-like cupin [Pseudovirgaria hyperparasitica]|uniref:RmlC-like cupin n=1 Tax=Pseudovirgaria hyperparasitica TaxID=470096 RepID=A0A6A6WD48_9PEZI|nr:RmlC-like cupin [Pseudovirgaria hyperparasitica]KAF2759984.1 RmlC-like cupin [Pseudovirgaria hyperparasitica]
MSPSITKILFLALTASITQAAPASSSLSARQAPAGPDIPFLESLQTAPSAKIRFQRLFTKDQKGSELLDAEALKKALVFDFNNGAVSAGGTVKSANVETFPVLTDLGISVTVANLGPCGINTPHVHPRATEFLTVVEGPGVDVGIILENAIVGAGKQSELTARVEKLQGTVFPVGSIHYQFNNNCDNTTFVAALNSEDPGTGQIAQNFLNLNDEVVKAVIGFPKSLAGADIQTIRQNIPANLAIATEACYQKCKTEGKMHSIGL